MYRESAVVVWREVNWRKHTAVRKKVIGVVMTGARCLRSRQHHERGGVSGLSSTATGRTSTMHCDLAARDVPGEC
jgi:hypothetical protein